MFIPFPCFSVAPTTFSQCLHVLVSSFPHSLLSTRPFSVAVLTISMFPLFFLCHPVTLSLCLFVSSSPLSVSVSLFPLFCPFVPLSSTFPFYLFVLFPCPLLFFPFLLFSFSFFPFCFAFSLSRSHCFSFLFFPPFSKSSCLLSSSLSSFLHFCLVSFLFFLSVFSSCFSLCHALPQTFSLPLFTSFRRLIF